MNALDAITQTLANTNPTQVVEVLAQMKVRTTRRSRIHAIPLDSGDTTLLSAPIPV